MGWAFAFKGFPTEGTSKGEGTEFMQHAHSACLCIVSTCNVNSTICTVLWHMYANKVPLVQGVCMEMYLRYYWHMSVSPAVRPAGATGAGYACWGTVWLVLLSACRAAEGTLLVLIRNPGVWQSSSLQLRWQKCVRRVRPKSMQKTSDWWTFLTPAVVYSCIPWNYFVFFL